MNDTQRLDFITKLVSKGHGVSFNRNGCDVLAQTFQRTGFGTTPREALDDLIDKMETTISERVAKRLTE